MIRPGQGECFEVYQREGPTSKDPETSGSVPPVYLCTKTFRQLRAFVAWFTGTLAHPVSFTPGIRKDPSEKCAIKTKYKAMGELDMNSTTTYISCYSSRVSIQLVKLRELVEEFGDR